MLPVRAAAALLMLLSACAPAGDDATAAARRAEPAADADGAAGAIDASDTLPAVSWNEVDRGRGLIHFVEAWTPAPRTDTMLLVRAPDDTTVVARFLWHVADGHSWTYVVERVEGAAIAANTLEYGYELAGLPLDSVTADTAWARVRYGRDASGAPQTAWVRLGDWLVLELWAQYLLQHDLFFIDPAAIAFHSQPDGSRVDFPVSGQNYQLEPDSAAGDWLRVRVIVPHFCTGEPAERDTLVWIRYRDAGGQPLVWYHTRGC